MTDIVEERFLETLAKLKSKDPEIYTTKKYFDGNKFV